MAGQAVLQSPGKGPISLANYSQTVGTTPVQLFPNFALPNTGFAPSYIRIINVSANGGPTVWLSRYTATPAANAPGCYPLAPGEYEEFRAPAGIPVNPIWAVATSSGCAVTAEAG